MRGFLNNSLLKGKEQKNAEQLINNLYDSATDDMSLRDEMINIVTQQYYREEVFTPKSII